MNAPRLLYHGTEDEKIFQTILAEGFKAGTYFTPQLDSAIVYGGRFVLTILDDGTMGDGWEVIAEMPVSGDRILYAHSFSRALAYVNDEALLDLKRRQLEKDGRAMCERCKGGGEIRTRDEALRYLIGTGGGAWKTRADSIVPCDECGGHGYRPV